MSINNAGRRNNVGANTVPAAPTTTGAIPAAPAGHTAPVAAFDGTHAGGAVPPQLNGGLPDALMQLPGNLNVVHGTDPGDYYCEHMFFQTQREAMKPGASVIANAFGERMVGFLHIPSDPYTYVEGATYKQSERHASTRQVVGSAFRGFYDEAAQHVARGPVKIMLNGYGTFMSTKDNPTGDFASHRENIDAAMKAAFGSSLVTTRGKALTHGAETDKGPHTYEYTIKDPKNGHLRQVHIQTQRFAVSDETINGNKDTSVQAAMKRFKPHAVMSMGVGMPNFTAEFHADNGGMRGVPAQHDDTSAATESMPDNRSLARAIHNGAKAGQASQGGGRPHNIAIRNMSGGVT